eukprot:TRINITY_DN748_c0_g12_i1.p1 TRINITY_DN748_c0_g12~~TRINITY_DN748_c0_g12_i1.p1  ORF type:complete len:315 (-),score=82.99 TRINITY_DN748_c0_g12_i1:766-1710(-)
MGLRSSKHKPVVNEEIKEEKKRPGDPRRAMKAHSEKVLPVKSNRPLPLVSSGVEIMPSQFIVENSENVYDVYTFQKKIGEGAFGVVYKAVHKVTHNARAIKKIMKDRRTKGIEASLMQEIAILKSLDHPNIVKLNEFFNDERYYYLVTEFVEGGELFDEIAKRGSLSEKVASHIMRQLLSAVVYCHKRKIVHRDLKPENILIVKSDKKSQIDIKVIDFGTAETFKSRAKMREFIGTAYYMSPEVIDGRYTEKCDVWSCGVILYILLSGYPPFGGKDDNAILRAIKRGKFNYNGTTNGHSRPSMELCVQGGEGLD